MTFKLGKIFFLIQPAEAKQIPGEYSNIKHYFQQIGKPEIFIPWAY